MKIFTGKVILARGDKTAKVVVERYVAHRLYKKKLKRTKKYLVHDEIGVKAGDRVSFAATKPISKLKRWKILEIVKAGK
ncbi:MAG: 30S ribosomal protein S17 [Patescibacteria group bacterium]